MANASHDLNDAAALVAAIEAKSERIETPCGDGAMVWHRWGQGEPLVLLHGGGGSWNHWVRNIEALSADRTVWCGDLPSFGDSALAPPPGDVTGVAAGVVEGIRRILPDGRKFDIAAFSFGGVVAGLVAAELGDQVRNLVLAGAAGLGFESAMAEPLSRWRGLSPEEARAVFKRNLALLMLYKEENIDDLAIYTHEVNIRRQRFSRRAGTRPGMLKETLPLVRARLAGIWGEHDPLASGHFKELEAMLREACPSAELRVIPDVGHWVPYEAADLFNRYLKELVARP